MNKILAALLVAALFLSGCGAPATDSVVPTLEPTAALPPRSARAVSTSGLPSAAAMKSGGRTFDIGFNDVVIAPNSELRFTERWDFLRSYVEDGEYIAFAEVHCLPHGMLSETRKFIVQTSRLQISMQKTFLPLETRNTWTYRREDTGAWVYGYRFVLDE